METYIISGIVALCGLYLLRDYIIPSNKPVETKAEINVKPKATRNFIEKMQQTQSNIIIFFGSQTGTAEDFANRLAKEGKQRFGLSCLVCDIECYDMDLLDTLPDDFYAIFLMATYGEGEPTDNANEFYHMLQDEQDVTLSQSTYSADDKPLEKLRYSFFGLGNRTYEHFNLVAKNLDASFTKFGGKRFGELGLGDDDGSLEDDFISWKEATWKSICGELNVDFVDSSSQITYSNLKITEASDVDSNLVHNGELHDKCIKSLGGKTTYDAKHPYCSPVKITRQLYTGDRKCVHLEVDLGDSGIKYETGDHIGLWPTNPESEVQLFARAFGLSEKMDTVISIESIDGNNNKKLFASPTTYSSLLRFYVDICSAPSRQFLGQLVPYIKSKEAKEWISKIADDSALYSNEILNTRTTMAEICLKVQEMEKDVELSSRSTIPLNLTLENLGRVSPRYYSISSSNIVHANTVHVTASVLEFSPESDSKRKVKGLFTNFLLSAHELLTCPHEGPSPYLFNASKKEDGTLKVVLPMHIRKSNFRLPRNPEVPVVMIGPGTGVAPFRAFVQERSAQAKSGKNVGPTMLFFGCRRCDEDFMYAEEWKELFEPLKDSEMLTAFSRQGDKKVYVQHLIREQKEKVWDLIDRQKGSIYVCGDAKYMAKDVNQCFVDMAKDLGGMSEEHAIAYVKKLRSQSRYQEDVWA
ncbi:hypothetical protein K502DRAFT_325036 [Neoconidiobolus thromboides FSU 785]|nr:hypothetical protein K502DRAFT_325036 [Neoconidiobolus thromboides FSU 785]